MELSFTLLLNYFTILWLYCIICLFVHLIIYLCNIEHTMALKTCVNACCPDQACVGFFRSRGEARAVVKCSCLFSPGGDAGAAGSSRRQLPADRWIVTPASIPALHFSLLFLPRQHFSVLLFLCYVWTVAHDAVLSASLQEIVNKCGA